MAHVPKRLSVALLTLVLLCCVVATPASAKSELDVFPYTTNLTTGSFDGAENVHYTDSGLVAYCLNRWLAAPNETGVFSASSGASVVKKLDYIRRGKFDGATTYKTTIFSPSWNSGGVNNANQWYTIQIRPQEQLMYLTIARNGYPYKTTFGDVTLNKTDAFLATQYAMWAVAYSPTVANWNETQGTYDSIKNWQKQGSDKDIYKAAWWLYSYAKEHASTKILDELDAYLYVPNPETKVKMVGGFTKPQSYQRFFVIHPKTPKVEVGRVKLAKISSNEALTKDNACYDLSNAYFHIYKGDTFALATDTHKWFKTGKQQNKYGHVVSMGYDADKPENDYIELAPGTYWVREEYSAKWNKPTTKSYTMPGEDTATVTGDTNGRVSKAYKVVVKSNQEVWVDDDSDSETGFVTNKPTNDPLGITISKYDKTGGKNAKVNGAASVAGAEFTVRYYDNTDGSTNSTPKRTWVIATDEDGYSNLSRTYFVRGDEFYTTERGYITLPMGTVTIQETKAPAGYLLEGQTPDSPADYQAPVHKQIISPDHANNENLNIEFVSSIPETVVTGGVAVQKLDAHSTPKTKSSLGSFEGAVFEVINENEGIVTVAGKAYKKDEVVTTLTTDASGFAKTDANMLPYGKYSMREVKAPVGYQLNTNKHFFTVDKLSEIVTVEIEDTPQMAGLKVVKRDSKTDTAQGSSTYAGAEFSILNADTRDIVVSGNTYKPGDTVLTITTDDTGVATTTEDALPFGRYKVVETKAPAGYTLNSSWSETIEVKEMGHIYSCECKDEVVRGGVELYKFDSDLLTNKPQGTTTLSNCSFSLINNNKTDVVVAGKTYKPGEVITTLTTDENGYAKTANDLLPYGNYLIRETKAPQGYLLNAEDIEVSVTENHALARITATDAVARGGLTVQKRDAEAPVNLDVKTTLTLAGAKFAITTENENEVVVGRKTYKKGDTVLTIETDDAGIASTEANVLPLGTYSVREVEAPVGYTLNKDFKQTVTITKNGEVVSAGTCFDLSIKGELNIFKHDSYTHTSNPTGTAKLEGATFEVVNASDASVVVSGKVIAPGKVVTTIVAAREGDEVVARTGRILPFGTYMVREVAAGAGYTLNADWSHTFTIDASGEAQNYVYDATCENLVKRVDWRFVKVDETTGKPMEGVPFKITSTTTGESHIILSDAQGIVDTSTSHIPHSQNTNANDGLVDADGWIDDELKVVDSGIWFAGVDGVEINDDLGALPFDTYTIEELRSASNYGHALFDFVFTPTDDESTYDLGTKDNKVIVVTSELLDTATTEHITKADAAVTLNDTVGYTNLVPGTTYTIVGTLHVLDKDGKDLGEVKLSDGSVYKVTQDFVAKDSTGEVTQTFEVDTTAYKNMRLVAFEEIYEKSRSIAEHKDISDALQTVNVPTLSTFAHNSSNSQFVEVSTNTKIVDTVSYKNLVPGKSYTLKGELHLKADDSVIAEAQASFVAEATDGIQDVVFIVDTTKFQGESAYLFEKLYLGDTLIAAHTDPTDAQQTIHIASLSSMLTRDGKSKTVALSATSKLTDKLSYKNLEKGATYTIKSELHAHSETGEDAGVITDKDGNPIEVVTTFVPENASGEISIDFEFDSSTLSTDKLTAYQRIYRGDILVVEHTDIEDKDQTVTLPRITTELLTSDGSHMLKRAAEVELTDKISYTGLEVGKTYTAKGEIHLRTKDGKDGGIYQNTVATATFTPETSDGTADITFKLNSEELDKDVLVAFEQVFEQDSLLATEADISNDAQAVEVEAKPQKPTAKTSDTDDALIVATLLSLIWTIAVFLLEEVIENRDKIKENLAHLLKK